MHSHRAWGPSRLTISFPVSLEIPSKPDFGHHPVFWLWSVEFSLHCSYSLHFPKQYFPGYGYPHCFISSVGSPRSSYNLQKNSPSKYKTGEFTRAARFVFRPHTLYHWVSDRVTFRLTYRKKCPVCKGRLFFPNRTSWSMTEEFLLPSGLKPASSIVIS